LCGGYRKGCGGDEPYLRPPRQDAGPVQSFHVSALWQWWRLCFGVVTVVLAYSYVGQVPGGYSTRDRDDAGLFFVSPGPCAREENLKRKPFWQLACRLHAGVLLVIVVRSKGS